MCSISGIVGANKLSINARLLITDALLISGASRGNQSAGIYNGLGVFKRAVNPENFIFNPKYEKMVKTASNLIMLHTRLPTSGKRGNEQAQPFVSGRTAITHNGYFFNIAELRRAFDLDKPSTVDSELILSYVRKYGVERLGTFLNFSDGPSAIAMHVDRDMFLARYGNPLVTASFMYHNSKVLVYASTEYMLQSAMQSIGVKRYKITELEDYTLYKVTSRLEVVKQRYYVKDFSLWK